MWLTSWSGAYLAGRPLALSLMNDDFNEFIRTNTTRNVAVAFIIEHDFELLLAATFFTRDEELR